MKIMSHAAMLLALLSFAAAPARAQDETATTAPAAAPATIATHGLAMHGAPKYAPDFTHFDYVNPNAPKGGTMKLAGYDTFDNLNPFIIKGVAAEGTTMIYDTLTESSADEPFTVYGGLSATIETPEDRSWVIFILRPEAKWHDGAPITAEDVKWSFETLTTKGAPFYRAYYHNVKSVEALDDRRVKFTFDMANNRELPLIVGQMPVLPKHYWTAEGRDFTATTLTPPLGSGPYKIGTVAPGRSIEYVRVKDWWGENVPTFKGRYNFDRIVYEYYKDQNVSLEAMFAGQYDFRQEYVAKLWASGYDAPAVKSGKIVKKIIDNDLPQGMQGFAFNLRRPVFQDKAVRKAMNYAFDFEWSNKQFASGAYTRTRSYFSNSEMEAKGLPEGLELTVLEQFRGKIPDEVFTQEYKNPQTDGSGNNRNNLREATRLLDEAGWKLGEDGIRSKDGVRLEFELLIAGVNEGFQRWFQPLEQNLAKLGIKGSIRTVDATQYTNRIMEFDYDMIIGNWGQSNSPGNEQREYWGSDRADAPGSRNYLGLKDPVVDQLVDMIVAAPTREDLVARTRALDRVLQQGWYVIPNWHIPAWRVAYWDKFEQPAIQAPYALGVMDTWWAKAAP
ncbi:MAG: extracellular solute-binding protein [Alphaproteobacteria bacterium]|nr:extracellular solute-binding protein [Alphaproteobacteria bacterium]